MIKPEHIRFYLSDPIRTFLNLKNFKTQPVKQTNN